MQKLGILVIHNRYQQPGGEDAVVHAEVEMLRRAGHRVIQYVRNNAEIACYAPLRKAALFLSTTWDRRSYAEVRALIRRERPDIAHCHNLLPLVSPAAYYACRSAGVPVVQTLHNYRLACPAGTLFAEGRRCLQCGGCVSHAVGRGCYRNSRLQTAAVSLMVGAHRMGGTWRRQVDAYLVPSHFCHDYFVAAGLLPANRIHVKPNFIAQDPGKRGSPGDYALFVGRLSAEKGVLEMIRAWSALRDFPLLVAGKGPLLHQARRLAEEGGSTVKFLGQLDREQILLHIKGARFLVFPSRWHEPFGLGLLEAAACGVPAIACRVGAIPELVIGQQTGLLFDPENFEELVEHVRWAWRHPAEMENMGLAARQLYRQKFTAETNYQSLMEIYGSLLRT